MHIAQFSLSLYSLSVPVLLILCCKVNELQCPTDYWIVLGLMEGSGILEFGITHLMDDLNPIDPVVHRTDVLGDDPDED